VYVGMGCFDAPSLDRSVFDPEAHFQAVIRLMENSPSSSSLQMNGPRLDELDVGTVAGDLRSESRGSS